MEGESGGWLHMRRSSGRPCEGKAEIEHQVEDGCDGPFDGPGSWDRGLFGAEVGPKLD